MLIDDAYGNAGTVDAALLLPKPLVDGCAYLIFDRPVDPECRENTDDESNESGAGPEPDQNRVLDIGESGNSPEFEFPTESA